MAQLAQAYIHLRPYEASERKLKALSRSAERIALKVAAEIYGGGVFIDVELEEGSLRTRLTVVGAIALGIYGHVADYKGFKESIVEMCEDARDFAVDVCDPFIQRAGVSKEKVYRFERRLKTPGKLYRLSKRLEKLEGSIYDLSPKALQNELARARSDLEAIMSDLSPEEKLAVEHRLRSSKLPPPSRWPEQEPPRLALKREEETQDQGLLFDGIPDASDDDAEPPRRVIYKKRTAVPETKIGRRKRQKRYATTPQLLPPSGTAT